MDLTEEDGLILGYTSTAIGRTGATSLEIGYLDDDPPSRWYATAQYQGAKVSCENQDDPVGAMVGLYVMLAAGGTCTKCQRTIALDGGDQGLVDGGRMRQGVFQSRAADGPRSEYCVRWLDLDGWTGCGETRSP